LRILGIESPYQGTKQTQKSNLFAFRQLSIVSAIGKNMEFHPHQNTPYYKNSQKLRSFYNIKSVEYCIFL